MIPGGILAVLLGGLLIYYVPPVDVALIVAIIALAVFAPWKDKRQ